MNPDFLYAALDATACAAFFKESRMKCANVPSCTGNPGPWRLSPLFHEDGQIQFFPAPPAESLAIRELC